MKRIITLVLFLFISVYVNAQTDGISYQAVIIGPDNLELPGVDSEDNYLPSSDVTIKFSIIAPGSGVVEFTEIQSTTTDEFGRINLIIGAEEHDDFEKIDWNGNPKSLKVEIDFNNGDGFMDMSIEKLTYVPYVAHRDITATGTLDVDDNTFLNGELQVNGPTTLNSTLDIADGNPANFSGDLNVDGETNLNNTFNVRGRSASNLSGALNVGDPLIGPPNGDPNAPTTLNGSLTVVGESIFTGLVADDLTINESTILNGSVDINAGSQVTITSTVHTDNIAYTSTSDRTDQVAGYDPGRFIGNYPLLVEGSTQGIAVKVIGNQRRNGNNFISFWDDTGQWGRIEGEVETEYANNADYLFDQSSLNYDVYDAEIDFNFAVANSLIADAQLIKAAIDYRPCAGPIPCVATPGLADVGFAAAEVISAVLQVVFAGNVKTRADTNLATYNFNKDNLVGVTYASGAGDYAEYLKRASTTEDMTFGDIVGVIGGQISKNTSNSERMMVVSHNPIVLGNIPKGDETQYEKVAFMGQVPVKVFGKVNIGDYIIPSGKNDGIGKAISPSKITSKEINEIVGVSWSNSNNVFGFSLVNVAVGLNRNDNNSIVVRLEKQVLEQALEINSLKTQIAEIHDMLANNNATSLTSKKVVNTKEIDSEEHPENYDDRKYEIVDTDRGEIIYWEITMEDFERGLKMAEDQMIANGIDVENNLMLKKIKTDSNFKTKIMNDVKKRLDKQIHYHKEIDKKGRH